MTSPTASPAADHAASPAADPVAEFRAATKTLSVVAADSTLGAHAREIVETLAAQVVVYDIDCLLRCGRTLQHEATVAEAAEYRGTPRGICGSCV